MEYVRFGELYLIPSSNGVSRPSAVRGQGYKMINMGELFSYDIINDIPMERVELSSKEKEKFLVQERDLLFARQSLVASGAGKCSIVKSLKEETTFESHLIRVRLEESKCNPWYYYYLFQLPYNPIKAIVNQCAQAGIRGKELVKIKVPYPLLQEQKKIADILSTYDELIENNNKRIKILEQMAENLYKEWFVRFRFPGHETTEFENGLPKGWKTKRFIEEFNITYGKGLPTEELLPKGYPVFGSNGLIGYYSKYMYEKPQVLISCRGASSGVVNISLPYSFITSNSLICEIDDRTETNFEYLSFALGDYKLVQYQTGSAQPQITIDNIKKLKIIIPSNEVLNDFKRFIGVINEKVLLLKNQNQNLIKQRDMLLPRLMSGKLEVKEAQEKVVAFKPKKTFAEFKSTFAAAARKDGGLTEQDMEELYKAYCDDSRDE